MVIQIANIVSGFMLAAPAVTSGGMKEHVGKAHGVLVPYTRVIGCVTFALGILALIERMSYVSILTSILGASYPQAIVALIAGALLLGAAHHAVVGTFFMRLEPHRTWIGVVIFCVGLISLL